MKQFIAILIFSALQFFNPAFGQNYPDYTGHVNDFAKIFPGDMARDIELSLREYERNTSIEIFIATIASLEGLTVEDYSIGLATKWKVGKKGKDNGLLILVAPKERKMRIEIGYGLEGDLPDAKARRIRDRFFIPHFKTGDMAKGISEGVKAIINELGSKPYTERAEERALAAAIAEKEKAEWNKRAVITVVVLAAVLIAAIFIWWIVIAIKRYNRRKKKLEELHVKNSVLLSDTSENIEKTRAEYGPALRTIEAMKNFYTPSVWQKLKEEFKANAVLTANLAQELVVLQKELSSGWKHAEKVNSSAHKLKNSSKDPANFFAKVTHIQQEQEESHRKCNRIIAEFPGKAEDAQKKTGHKDVSAEARRAVLQAGEDFRTASEKLGQKPVDWVLMLPMLAAASTMLERAVLKADDDINFASRARSEGPGLLKELPQKFTDSSKALDHKDVTQSTRNLLDRAAEKFLEGKKLATPQSQTSPIDWLAAFALLLGANELIEQAEEKAKSDIAEAELQILQAARKRKKPNSSGNRLSIEKDTSSEWSSGSIINTPSDDSPGGNDFSGAGGGAFGGGGVSGDW